MEEYNFVCEMCDTEITVTVVDVDEKPNFCPMCGNECEIEE